MSEHNIPTPHIAAQAGEIAETILLPGDPLRAKYIADNFLTDVKQFNATRNMFGYTGSYKGKRVSVMGTGMGCPSIGIYSYELFTQYGVERIIRIGSAGAYTERLKLYDVVLAEECWSESSFGKTQNGDEADVKYPDPDLNKVIMEAGKECGIEVKPAKIHSSDVFYSEPGMDGFKEIYEKHGCECVEMESFALFHNARVLGKKAACLLTISDSMVTGEKTSAKERQEAFGNMMEVALKAAAMMED